jgi:hypothetical protein
MGWILYHAQPLVSKAAKETKHNVLFMAERCLRAWVLSMLQKD